MNTSNNNTTGHEKTCTRTFVAIILTAAWFFTTGLWPSGFNGSEAHAEEGFVSSVEEICLHVSSFSGELQAQHEVTRLEGLGYPCLYRAEDVLGKTWFRVYLTGFDSMIQARRTGKTLLSGGKITYYRVVGPNAWAPLPDKAITTPPRPEPVVSRSDHYDADTSIIPDTLPVLVMTEQENETPLFERAGDPYVTKSVLKIVGNGNGYRMRKEAIKESSYPFSVSVRTGAYFMLNAKDFELTGIDDYDDIIWDISDNILPMLAVVAQFRPTEYLSIEGSAEKLFSDQLDIMFLSLAPKYLVELSNGISAYITCGIVYGKLYWDDAPGEFDCALGLNAGAGIMTSLLTPRLTVGCGMSYRSMEFDYKMPHEDDIVSYTDEALNLTGFSFSVDLSYHF